ncbi:MAG: hypothetical protein JO022_19720 [Acidobacteriaceae bacterium]|nr:hypothetical protein [Acidobacteriaceae bacterium]
MLSPERWRLVAALKKCTGPIYVSEDATRQLPKIRRLLRMAGIAKERCAFLTDVVGPKHWVDRLLHFGTTTPIAYAHLPNYPVADSDRWTSPRLSLDDVDRADRDQWLRRNGIAHLPIVLVQPGNRRAIKWRRARHTDSKAWPIGHWAQLLRAVRQISPRACVLLCGSVDEEPLLKQIRGAAQVTGVNVVTSELPLRRLLALLEVAHSMVSVDTGPSHMAAAMGCPLVVLYGTEPRDVWGRRGPPRSRIVEIGGIPPLRSTSEIGVELVIAAWRSLCGKS